MKKRLVFFGMLALAAVTRAATADIAWDAVTTNADGTPISDLSGYRVYVATRSLLSMTTTQAMSNTSVTKTVVSASTTSATVNGLANGTSYYFRLTAYDTSGNQSGFNWDGSVDQELTVYVPSPTVIPASPAALTATVNSSTQITLTWADVVDEDGYVVERALSSDGVYAQVASLGADVTTYVNSGLSAGTAYSYRVRSFNAVGNAAAYSPVANAQTTASPSGVLTGSLPGLKEAYAYPNPAKTQDPTIRAMMGGVDSVEITIFDQAGRAVMSDSVTQTTMVDGETAYEYRWTAPKANGTYYAVIHGKKGNETIRARAKFAVIR